MILNMGYNIDSKKLECGPPTTHAGYPSFRGFRVAGLASTVPFTGTTLHLPKIGFTADSWGVLGCAELAASTF